LGGIWNNAAFIDRMKIGNIPGRFFFCFEKAANLEPMTEGQAGPDKKNPSILLFDVRRNQYRLTLIKSKLRRNLKTDHRKPPVIPPAL
jgi:hypothetical protein